MRRSAPRQDLRVRLSKTVWTEMGGRVCCGAMVAPPRHGGDVLEVVKLDLRRCGHPGRATRTAPG